MYKQRNNESHAPMTVDPYGQGMISSAITAATRGADPLALDNSHSGGPAVATSGSLKRGRDIRGLNRFRSVVYGEDGFRRFHAMVARNPILMYPPEGIEDAVARVELQQREATERQLQENRSATVPGQREGEDGADVFALFEERAAMERATATTEHVAEDQSDVAAAAVAAQRDGELAKYHHQQLDSYLRLLYEFNHVSFVKLPMEDTLQLLARCGKEAVAHVVEYETQIRLSRQARLKELKDLQEEKKRLQKRRLAVEEAEAARLLAEAEQEQTALDRTESDRPMSPATAAEGEQPHHMAEDARKTAPPAHFALDDTVKEEDEVKDLEAMLEETAAAPTADLPVVPDADVTTETHAQ